MADQKFKRGDRVVLPNTTQGRVFGVVNKVTSANVRVTPDGHPDKEYKVPHLYPLPGRIELSTEPLPEADKPAGPQFTKGERVAYTHSKDGTSLGVIGSVSPARGTVQFVPDDGWSKEGHTYYTVNTLHPQAGKLERSDAPLPDDCKPLDDDPVRLAGFTAKVTGMAMANEGYAYNLKVLLNGRDTKIIFNEGGYGGEVEYETRGADPKVVKAFEEACEAWSAHYGVLGPHRDHITAHDVWQSHEFDMHLRMKDNKSLPNFPVRRVSRPEPWEFTFKERKAEAEG